jgi:hypothetical protein
MTTPATLCRFSTTTAHRTGEPDPAFQTLSVRTSLIKVGSTATEPMTLQVIVPVRGLLTVGDGQKPGSTPRQRRSSGQKDRGESRSWRVMIPTDNGLELRPVGPTERPGGPTGAWCLSPVRARPGTNRPRHRFSGVVLSID